MMKDTNKKSLQSVKLVDGGLKGIVVSYGSSEVRDNVRYYNEHTVKHRAPVSEDMLDKFRELKQYMLQICGYVGNEAELKNMAQNLTITAVKYNSDGFLLTGTMNVLAGDKVVALNTPLVADGNEYFDFVQVAKILDEVFEETSYYIDGAKTPTQLQIAMKFADKNPEIDRAAINAMDDASLTSFLMPLIDKLGHCLILNTELVEDKGDTATTETKDVSEGPEVAVNEPVTLEAPIVVEKVKSEVNITASFGDDEEFSLDIKAPVTEKSTAKLI